MFFYISCKQLIMQGVFYFFSETLMISCLNITRKSSIMFWEMKVSYPCKSYVLKSLYFSVSSQMWAIGWKDVFKKMVWPLSILFEICSCRNTPWILFSIILPCQIFWGFFSYWYIERVICISMLTHWGLASKSKHVLSGNHFAKKNIFKVLLCCPWVHKWNHLCCFQGLAVAVPHQPVVSQMDEWLPCGEKAHLAVMGRSPRITVYSWYIAVVYIAELDISQMHVEPHFFVPKSTVFFRKIAVTPWTQWGTIHGRQFFAKSAHHDSLCSQFAEDNFSRNQLQLTCQCGLEHMLGDGQPS